MRLVNASLLKTWRIMPAYCLPNAAFKYNIPKTVLLRNNFYPATNCYMHTSNANKKITNDFLKRIYTFVTEDHDNPAVYTHVLGKDLYLEELVDLKEELGEDLIKILQICYICSKTVNILIQREYEKRPSFNVNGKHNHAHYAHAQIIIDTMCELRSIFQSVTWFKTAMEEYQVIYKAFANTKTKDSMLHIRKTSEEYIPVLSMKLERWEKRAKSTGLYNEIAREFQNVFVAKHLPN